MSEESHPNERHMTPRKLFYLALGSVGVVYGDIGTSPLYAFREALKPVAHDGVTRFEVISLISLMILADDHRHHGICVLPAARRQ